MTNTPTYLYLMAFSILSLIGCSSNQEQSLDNKATNTKNEQATPSEAKIDSPKIKALSFTDEQLQQYYKVYDDPFVIHIRTALNNFISGNLDGISVEKAELLPYQEYFQHKFIVYTIEPHLGGGWLVNILFPNKLDKMFSVWVYDQGNYDLRDFHENTDFTTEDLKTIEIQYKKLLMDEEHSL
ncbi:MAG: hypothetical protein GY810_27710 [Aureispira sp.]|nr:hypothetical protein [Aureispira sp.]